MPAPPAAAEGGGKKVEGGRKGAQAGHHQHQPAGHFAPGEATAFDIAATKQ